MVKTEDLVILRD